MPFLSYQATPADNGGWLLEEPLPLIFSGRNGIIARYVKTSLGPDSDNLCWTLLPDDIQALMEPPSPPLQPPADNVRWMVFVQKEGDHLRLSRILRIRGTSNRQTELLFTFSPLHPAPSSDDVESDQHLVQEPSHARQWSEELALNGGIASLDDTWTWHVRELNLGAAVIG